MPEAAETTETEEFQLLDIQATSVPESLDEEGRRVTFIASTGARGIRRHWRGDYYEELEVSDTAIDLARLNNNAPFLNSHWDYQVEDVIGVIERGWVENDKLLVTVRFSTRDTVEPIFRDIASGILCHVSVGYWVHEYVITQTEGELDVYRATKWEPAEVSIVPLGFDDGAVARGAGKKLKRGSQVTMKRAAAHSEEAAMPDKVEDKKIDHATRCREIREAVATAKLPESLALDLIGEDITVDDARKRIIEECAKPEETPAPVAEPASTDHATRCREIREAVATAKLPEAFALDLIGEDISADEARKRIIDEWAKTGTDDTRGHVRARVDQDSVYDIREAATNALMHRNDPAGVAIEDASKVFANMSMLRLSEELLSLQGVNVRGMSPMQLAARAISTSDLEAITANVANKSLLMGYMATPRTFANVFRQASVSDFKPLQRTRLSGTGELTEVKEDGEFTYGKVTDEKETYYLSTYGKILPFTRQSIVNDDLDALSRIPMSLGNSASNLESKIVWAIVTANAPLADNKALFHAGHNNLAAAGANPTLASLSDGRKSMREQKGMDGELINVMAEYLIVGANHETVVDQLLSNIQAQQTDQVVPEWIRSLIPVIEPRLTGNAWYLASNYNQVDTIEYAYLEGNQGVYIETKEGFDQDGIKIKVRHDFGAKAIDFRGMYKNPGE